MTSTLIPPLAFTNKFAFGEPKLRTDGAVLAVSFGKDGALYSIEEMGILRKWNPGTGQQLEWQTLSDMESLWAFSSDGRVLASGSDDLAIWDASSGVVLTSIAQPSWVTALAFHSDASFVATGHDDGTINYWDVPGHHPLFEKSLAFHKMPISAIAVSPDGKKLAAASEDKNVSLWDVATGKYVGCLSGHTDRIAALAWHPSGAYLVSAGWDTTARVWDAQTLQPAILLNSHATQVNAIAFSADGRWLASADSSQTIHVWDFDKKKTIHKLKLAVSNEGGTALGRERRARPRPEEPVLLPEICTLAFSPDGKYLACNGECTIHLWNPETGTLYADQSARPCARTTVSIGSDGRRLVSNGGGSAARIWDTASHQVIATLEAPSPIHALVVSHDGKWIAGSLRNNIRLWDGNGKFVADWDGPEEPVTTLAFSHDSRLLASGSARGVAVWIWRVADGETVLNIQDALDGCSIEALAFHPDNNHLAVGGIDRMATTITGNDGQVSLINLAERAEVTSFFDGATALAMHPSGDILASNTLDNSIFFWDLQLKKLVQEFVGHDGAVTCLAFSPGGSWLVSGSEDHTLRVWDDKGHERAIVEVESHVTSLAFSADGVYLFAGHANTTCSQWQVPDLLRGK